MALTLNGYDVKEKSVADDIENADLGNVWSNQILTRHWQLISVPGHNRGASAYQSFEAEDNYELKVSQIAMSHLGGDTGDLEVVLYEADMNHRPKGNELMKVTIPFGTPDLFKEFREIDWETGINPDYQVHVGTLYVIEIRRAEGEIDTSPARGEYVGLTGNTYADGRTKAQTDYWGYDTIYTGWTDYPNNDVIFRNFGTTVVIFGPNNPSPLQIFPLTRPGAYDPDLIWVPGEWTDPNTYVSPEWGGPSRYFATGGGKWGQQLVAVGNGKVYYTELD